MPPRTPLLDRVKIPADMRNLSAEQLKQLADELRAETIDTVSVTGGHLGASLGVVELTVAVHAVFETPRDRLIWDVGHQTYPHKILTGRRDRIRTLIAARTREMAPRDFVEMLRSAGHDFVLLQVHSAEEQRPSAAGELILEDAETGKHRTVDCSPASTAAYEKKFLEFSARIRRLALRNGGRYARAVTNIPYQEFVLRSLRSGQVLA